MLEVRADAASKDGTVVYRCSLPAKAASATAARVLLGGMLTGFSRLDDALSVVTELMGHAVREDCPCCPPATVDLVARIGASSVRLEVGFGCADLHTGEWDEEMVLAYTWGVVLMRQLADRWGQDTIGQRCPEHQTWWAEIDGEFP